MPGTERIVKSWQRNDKEKEIKENGALEMTVKKTGSIIRKKAKNSNEKEGRICSITIPR
ncbi:MAG: hypothetical protein Q4B85_06830 [Lachnospiraceae bacterium]|nr:hypothetical protein [Lachnospiraceae bacterium]